IGRHVIFANLMQTDAYGIELTQKAVQVAWKWAKEENMTDAEKKIVQGTITQMPFENNFFDFVVSHGVLDSMDLPIISAGIKETARVMRPGGYFYCDLIGQDNHHPENFHGAEIVKDDHEKGTIQFYYTEEFIKNIFGDDFEIVEMTLIKRQNQLTHAFSSRYHVIFKKK
ncbi:MAG TPA: class I SAM-dependent methyltransferase, partial [Bacteroidia bacterium]|nr:class I SAM-dependent methyltransferase [Bacteroidia bacterium]